MTGVNDKQKSIFLALEREVLGRVAAKEYRYYQEAWSAPIRGGRSNDIRPGHGNDPVEWNLKMGPG